MGTSEDLFIVPRRVLFILYNNAVNLHDLLHEYDFFFADCFCDKHCIYHS